MSARGRIAPIHPDTIEAQRQRCGWPTKHEAWADELVEPLPSTWARRLLTRWNRAGQGQEASLDLGRRCRSIRGAMRAGLRADANDEAICEQAKQSARDTARRLGYIERKAKHLAASERVTMLAKVVEARALLAAQGIAEAFDKLCKEKTILSALARVVCERWWRRVLRVLHARAVEGTARAIGLVNKWDGLYASHDAVKRRTGQRARNARALESVEAVNERNQRYTLAELAAKSPANREIRRHELMTRIAGFDLVAVECDHVAIMATVTCPSRMHAQRTTRNGGTEENPKWDGTTPHEAQRHLAKQWGKCGAAAARAGLAWYGFRIAEPNHDGTPHWHLLLFFPKVGAALRGRAALRGLDVLGERDQLEVKDSGRGAPAGDGRDSAGFRVAVFLLRRYFLWASDADERGAEDHRVKVVPIDREQGSAAGYVAKYVAKNIDGEHVGKDLFGNDAITASMRVDAWASTWRVRQFQQIGGAPVGIWRELRREHPEQAEASFGHALMLDAVNVAATAPDAKGDEGFKFGRVTAAHGWRDYTIEQGGPRVPRCDLRVRINREQSGEIGRYGDVLPPKPIGTYELAARRAKPFGIVGVLGDPPVRLTRTVRVEVESERSLWIIVPKGAAPPGGGALPRTARPWSPVNNSTRPISLAAFTPLGPMVERHPKRGKFVNWASRAAPPEERPPWKPPSAPGRK